MTSFITEATQHFLPKITSLGLISTLQVIQIHDWLPLCYLQNSNKYIKKIYWLCDKADYSQLIKLVSESFSRKGKKIPSGGSLSCCAVWYNSSLFLFRVKHSAKEINKKPSQRKKKKKKRSFSLPPTLYCPLPPKERWRILETGVYSQHLTKSRLPLD